MPLPIMPGPHEPPPPPIMLEPEFPFHMSGPHPLVGPAGEGVPSGTVGVPPPGTVGPTETAGGGLAGPPMEVLPFPPHPPMATAPARARAAAAATRACLRIMVLTSAVGFLSTTAGPGPPTVWFPAFRGQVAGVVGRSAHTRRRP